MHDRPTKPSFLGLRVLDDFPLTALVPFIDWSPLFHAWQLKGTYPRIFEDSIFGPRAIEVFQDAWGLLESIVADRSLHARAVYGFWPANSVGDDIQLFADDSRTTVIATLHTLRQQTRKADGEFNYALADFIAPVSSGIRDYIGAFAVTAGIGVDELCAKFESNTTTTIRLWRKRWPIVWRKHSQSVAQTDSRRVELWPRGEPFS